MKLQGILVGLATSVVWIGSTQAQTAGSWDGTWSGTTERGGSVQVVVLGNRATSYVFRGQSVNVTGSQAFGNNLTITVNGGVPGTVRLTKGKGQTANYTYSDTSGGSAKATLSRR